ncbi:hypothetical protein KKD03_04975 [Patescibacteria group bacterium]|nr:hypothetical protein [Patescibacteria group bacterium]
MKLIHPLKLTRPFSSKTQFGRSSSTSNSIGAGVNPGSRPKSFGEKRSQDANDRYKKSLKERKKIVRAQYSVDGSLKKVYEMKSNLLDRKIRRMKDER